MTSTLQVNVNLSGYEELLRELASGLESRDILERFPRELFSELKNAVDGGLIGESLEFVGKTAGGALELAVEIKRGGLLERCIAALRALRCDFESNDVSHSGASV